jgi:thymidylate kinase
LSFYTPRRRNRPFLVLDEGLLQRSFLLFMEQDGFGSVDRVGRYIEAIPLPDVVVAVDLSPAESLARVRHRTRLLPRRFQNMAENDQLNAFNQGAELLDLVLARALDRADSSTQVIRIPGNDLEQAKRRLAAEIAEKLRIRVPQP